MLSMHPPKNTDCGYGKNAAQNVKGVLPTAFFRSKDKIGRFKNYESLHFLSHIAFWLL